MLPQAALVDGSDLLQQNDGILTQPHAASCNVDVGGELGFSRLAGNCGCDHSGGVAVAGVVLHDQNGPGAALLTAHHRGQIRIEYVAPLHSAVHLKSHSVARDALSSSGCS